MRPSRAAAAILAGIGLLAVSATIQAKDAGELERLQRVQARLVKVIEKALPAVVFIDRGSGVVVSDDGLIVTNDHVVGTETELEIRFALTGIRKQSRLLGKAPTGDLALLQIVGDEKGFPHLPLGDSDALEPGQRTLALGNPFLLGGENEFFPAAPPDFHPTVTFGIVSAMERNAPPRYPSAIQVDVPVNPGNSGGPLITLNGEVVGINGKIETKYGLALNSGVGYAVPSNQIRRFLEPLRKAGGGTIAPGLIYGLEVDERAERNRPGLPVRLVVRGSHAERAGFRRGDRILAIDGHSVGTQHRFIGLLQTYPVGSRVEVDIVRGDDRKQILAELVLPSDKPVKLGIRTEPAAEGDDRLRVSEVQPGSPAALGGLKVGDVILQFDDKPLKSIADLISRMKAKRTGDVVALKVVRGEQELDLSVTLLPFTAQ